MNENEQKWYDKKWLVLVLCLFIFPVGIYAFWKNTTIKPQSKIAIIIIVTLLALYSYYKNTPEQLVKQKIEARNDSIKNIETIRQDSINNIPKIDSSSLYYYSKVMAKKYVTENLKAPSTAKFTDENIHIGLERDSSVVVKISVDAQNTFGAMFRNDFYLKMKWSKKFDDTDNWVLIDIQNETE